MIGILTGSGLYNMLKVEEKIIRTEEGAAIVGFCELEGEDVALISRHGKGHELPPHKVTYHANLKALKEVGCENVLGVYATGILSKYKPGDIVLASDFIGTHVGVVTFYDRFGEGVVHTDFSEPFSKKLKGDVKKAAKKVNVKLKDGGVIATTPGPRYESATEVKMLKKAGANLVSMTNAYETILAGELGLEFCAIAVATNYGTGIKKGKLTFEEVYDIMKKREGELKKIIINCCGK